MLIGECIEDREWQNSFIWSFLIEKVRSGVKVCLCKLVNIAIYIEENLQGNFLQVGWYRPGTVMTICSSFFCIANGGQSLRKNYKSVPTRTNTRSDILSPHVTNEVLKPTATWQPTSTEDTLFRITVKCWCTYPLWSLSSKWNSWFSE